MPVEPHRSKARSHAHRVRLRRRTTRATDWTVQHGLPDVDPVLGAREVGEGSFWHDVKSSVRTRNIVDDTALTTVCGAELGRRRPVVWAGAGDTRRATCARCAAKRRDALAASA